MSKFEAAWGTRPATASLIAGGLIVAGVLLTNVSWWWLMLAAIGVFGPGVLRELGWLSDKDEFQLLASYRAGYHAYVAIGVLAFLMVAYFRSSGKQIDQPQEIATLFLVLLCLTWFLSSLVGYWGAQKAAFRFLVTIGCGWLFFSIVSNVGSEWTGWTALMLHPMLTLPFFGLAWISTRWPKIAGISLLAFSVFFTVFFGLFRREHISMINQAVTFVLFLGPLIASGIALIGTRARDSSTESDGST